jgi:hypothetical protein
MAKKFDPKIISLDEFLQFNRAEGQNQHMEVIECFEREMHGDDVVVLQAGIGSHPSTDNTTFSSVFSCTDVRQAGTAFDDLGNDDPAEVGWCGDTAIGGSYTLISAANNYNDLATPGKSSHGPNIGHLVYGTTDAEHEALGKKILALRKIALGGKLVFQVSWVSQSDRYRVP